MLKLIISLYVYLIFIVIVGVHLTHVLAKLVGEPLKNTIQENLIVEEQEKEHSEIDIYIITILIFFIL